MMGVGSFLKVCVEDQGPSHHSLDAGSQGGKYFGTVVSVNIWEQKCWTLEESAAKIQ